MPVIREGDYSAMWARFHCRRGISRSMKATDRESKRIVSGVVIRCSRMEVVQATIG
jgi:hypothetical protein